ncbi:MAG: hypothetical protein ACTSRA_00665 [Promethearchaeota archaeon]|nr:MAG: hypothetical protein [Helarchaeota virus Nidhogg Meg22_1012]URC17470.1 MAG: hypothetical protein [Helarchaeota virus Nidhogg Meg22_1214]
MILNVVYRDEDNIIKKTHGVNLTCNVCMTCSASFTVFRGLERISYCWDCLEDFIIKSRNVKMLEWFYEQIEYINAKNMDPISIEDRETYEILTFYHDKMNAIKCSNINCNFVAKITRHKKYKNETTIYIDKILCIKCFKKIMRWNVVLDLT